MNTRFTLIGSDNLVLSLIYALQMGHRLSVVNPTKITNHKSIKDDSVILSLVETLLSSAGFDTYELNIASGAIRNAKIVFK